MQKKRRDKEEEGLSLLPALIFGQYFPLVKFIQECSSKGVWEMLFSGIQNRAQKGKRYITLSTISDLC